MYVYVIVVGTLVVFAGTIAVLMAKSGKFSEATSRQASAFSLPLLGVGGVLCMVGLILALSV